MPTVTVRTTYLEQTDPQDLRPARPPYDIDVVRAEVPSPEFSRFLYTAVGGDWHWVDRRGWTREQWQSYLERPGVETWVAWHRGTPAGYVEAHPPPVSGSTRAASTAHTRWPTTRRAGFGSTT
ncbi:MAG TPA: hypothetical protein VEX15_06695 [Nocardioidaceae bacterium]|nr:hypothetical protein [Nocardioidaceae bacterium]